MRLKSDVARVMNAMVMANPTEFWMAKTVHWLGGAAWADKAETCGDPQQQRHPWGDGQKFRG